MSKIPEIGRTQIMRAMRTVAGGFAGLGYGGAAALLAYSGSPLGLRAFIAGGVAVVGTSVGWLLGLVLSQFCRSRRVVEK
jgi:hypothetical protein